MGVTTRDLALYTPEMSDTVDTMITNLATNFEDIDVAHSDHVGSTGGSHGLVTTTVAGFMSSGDKEKLNNIENNAKDDQSWGEITGTLSNQTDLQDALDNAENVFEYTDLASFPATGESNKIYIALDTNLPYRWNGTDYTEISKSLELGETSTTAYRGDRGKEAYDNYTASLSGDGNSSITLTKNDGTTISTSTSHGHSNATTTADGFMSSEDKSKLNDIDLNANNYSHPTYNGDDFDVDSGALSGATVIDDININVTTDGLGHVTDANGVIATRNLTLADLGYTGASNANNYSHPTYNSDDFSIDTGHLGGATVIDDIDINLTSDNLGHVVDANAYVATRNLTPANIGAVSTSTFNSHTGDTSIHTEISSGTSNPSGGSSGDVYLQYE